MGLLKGCYYSKTKIIKFVFIILILLTWISLLNWKSVKLLLLSRDPCKYTDQFLAAREFQGAFYLNPGRYLVEELLQYIEYSPQICTIPNLSKETDLLLVVLVHSGRVNLPSRNLIRKSWGATRKYKNWHVRVLFLIGQTDYCFARNKSLEPSASNEEYRIMQESYRYGDIVIGGFTDSYKNLTYKHLMGYKFVLEQCPKADFVIKTDDDIFVNLPKILDYRNQELKATNATLKHDTYCYWYNVPPFRCPNCSLSKWYVSYEDWPHEKYPPFCLGGGYGISMPWLRKVYGVRHVTKFLWIDDVFVNGVLMKVAEKKYGSTVNALIINGNITDMRWNPKMMFEVCKNQTLDTGMFALLHRNWVNIQDIMKCLWRDSLRRKNLEVDSEGELLPVDSDFRAKYRDLRKVSIE